MRCPDCNKFVPFDTDTEPELDARVDDEGVVEVEARICNTCAECGAELTEGTFQIEIDLSAEVAPHLETCKSGKAKGLSVDAEGTRSDRFQEKDRNGKVIRSHRYRRHYYGVDVSAVVTCECGETFSGTASDEMTAGSMESLV